MYTYRRDHVFYMPVFEIKCLHHPLVSRPLIRRLFLDMCSDHTTFSIAYTLAATVYETVWIFVLLITDSAVAIFIPIDPCIGVVIRPSLPCRVVRSKVSLRGYEYRYTGMPYAADLSIFCHVEFFGTIDACREL